MCYNVRVTGFSSCVHVENKGTMCGEGQIGGRLCVKDDTMSVSQDVGILMGVSLFVFRFLVSTKPRFSYKQREKYGP